MKTKKRLTAADPVVYSVKEVSQMLHTGPALVYQFINVGLLPALKLGSIRVRKDALDEFLLRYEGCDLSNPQEVKQLCQTH